MIKIIIKFVKEAIRELHKVTWPTRPTVIRLTIGVLIVSIIFAIFVGLVDLGVTKGLRGLLNLVPSKQTTTSTIPQSIDISPDDIQIETTPVN